MHNFNKLNIWNDSMDLAQTIYETTKDFPKQEMYGIVSQMQRCAISIPSNIAEGAGRSSDKDFGRFLGIAIGSTFELHTQVLLAERIGYIDNSTSQKLSKNINTLQRQIISFKKCIEIDSENDIF